MNVRAPYFLVRAALTPCVRLPPRRRERVVGSRRMYRRRQTLYGLTKAALEHLTMNLAAELAPDRIRVACVRPGPVATEIHTGGRRSRGAAGGRSDSSCRSAASGEPEEIARWIWHLVDREAAWVTGPYSSIDGGRVLGPPGGLTVDGWRVARVDGRSPSGSGRRGTARTPAGRRSRHDHSGHRLARGLGDTVMPSIE